MHDEQVLDMGLNFDKWPKMMKNWNRKSVNSKILLAVNRVGIAGGWGLQPPPSSCLQTLISE